MIACFLLVATIAETISGTVIEPESTLQWMSGRFDPEVVGPLSASEHGIVLPLVSRTEVVARAQIEDDMVNLHVESGAGTRITGLSLVWARHKTDERILATGQGWLVSGPPLLPTQMTGVDPELLMRQDGFGAALPPNFRVVPPSGSVQAIAIPTMSTTAGIFDLQDAPLKLDASLAGSAQNVDQLYFTQTRLQAVKNLEPGAFSAAILQASDQRKLDPIPETIAMAADQTLLLSLPAPRELPEGETWSLLLKCEQVDVTAPSSPKRMAPVAAEPALLRAHPLDRPFLHQEGPDLQLDIRPTMGPGAAWGDVNGDGFTDLYLVQGAGRSGGPALSNRLLLGDGQGGFTDGTTKAGLGHSGAGMGALMFDAEGDGDLDLFVANYGLDVLYLNDGQGQFSDATVAAGFALDRWSASAVAADYDGDGDLDLYVTAYLDFDPAKMPPAAELNRYQRDDPIEMLPFAFPGQPNALYRNDSDADGVRFTNVAEELGVANPEGLSMQALWWDFDRDGDQDLYVANDVSFNVLYRNDGGTFTDITFAVGLDDPRGGMGLEAGDLDRDGDEDLILTNWEIETNALYLNNAVKRRSGRTRKSRFHDNTVSSGLGASGIGRTSWSPVLMDIDLDGDLDLYVANGYTSPDYESTGICVAQPDQIFVNSGRGRFKEVPPQAGQALAASFVSRAAVPCDFDGDGDIDVLVTANNGPARLLAGTAADRDLGHWLGLRLRQSSKNPFAIGAEVTVTAQNDGAKLIRRSLRAGSGYLGGTPPELHFGLGDWPGPSAAVEIRWPDGEVTQHKVRIDGWRTLERP